MAGCETDFLCILIIIIIIISINIIIIFWTLKRSPTGPNDNKWYYGHVAVTQTQERE